MMLPPLLKENENENSKGMMKVYDYAMQLVGLPYRWGGDDTIEGFDCSGLVQEILATTGEHPPEDKTAQGLFDYFSERGRGSFNTYGLGSLAFYGRSVTKITHVAFCLDTYRMIEAGGGGSKTHSVDDAAKHNAYVRVRLIDSRKDLQAVIKPYYRKIGVI